MDGNILEEILGDYEEGDSIANLLPLKSEINYQRKYGNKFTEKVENTTNY